MIWDAYHPVPCVSFATWISVLLSSILQLVVSNALIHPIEYCEEASPTQLFHAMYTSYA